LSPFVVYDDSTTYNPTAEVEGREAAVESTADSNARLERDSLAKMMMSNKKRKLLERIEKSKALEQAAASKLKEKARA
jgi:hypothetical protein